MLVHSVAGQAPIVIKTAAGGFIAADDAPCAEALVSGLNRVPVLGNIFQNATAR